MHDSAEDTHVTLLQKLNPYVCRVWDAGFIDLPTRWGPHIRCNQRYPLSVVFIYCGHRWDSLTAIPSRVQGPRLQRRGRLEGGKDSPRGIADQPSAIAGITQGADRCCSHRPCKCNDKPRAMPCQLENDAVTPRCSTPFLLIFSIFCVSLVGLPLLKPSTLHSCRPHPTFPSDALPARPTIYPRFAPTLLIPDIRAGHTEIKFQTSLTTRF